MNLATIKIGGLVKGMGMEAKADALKNLQAPSVSDENRFKMAMSAPPSENLAPIQSNTIGDQAIKTIKEAGDSMSARIKDIQKTFSSSTELNHKDFLKVQWQLTMVSTQIEVTNKCATSVTNNAEMLLKTQ